MTTHVPDQKLKRDFHNAFDFDDPEFGERYDDVISELHEHCPVARSTVAGGYWVVTKYEDLRRCGQDWQTFSSAQGVIPNRPGGMPMQYPVEIDPPVHSALRRTLNPFFSPTVLAGYEQRIREVADQTIDTFIADGHCDFMAAFARPFPATIFFTDFMSLPSRDVPYLKAAVDQSLTGPQESRGEGWAKVWNYLDGYLRDRMAGATFGDVVDAVLTFDAPGDDEFTHMDRVSTMSALIFGGLETTTNLLGHALRYLAQHPEDLERMAAEPALAPSAVEEFLRMFASTFGLGRTATADTTIGDREIKKGDFVLLGFGAACRDPEVFPDPDRFDLSRNDSRHAAFGMGPHRCIGSHLARMELVIALERLVSRLADVRIDPTGEVVVTTSFVRAVEHLPLLFTVREDGQR